MDRLEEKSERLLAPKEQMAHEARERDLRGENLRRLMSDHPDALEVVAETVAGNRFTLGDGARVTQAGNDIYFYNYGRTEERPQAAPLTPQEVAQLDLAHIVITESISRLVEHLRSGCVGIVSGQSGTGRATAGLAALAHGPAWKTAEARIGVFPAGVDPYRLRAGDLREKTGYLLDATGAEWVRRGDDTRFRHLSHLARSAGCSFVILVDGSLRPVPEHGETLVVTHRAPPPIAVFERVLAYRLSCLNVSDPQKRARATASEVRVYDELGGDSGPREASGLARSVAQSVVDGRGLDEVLDERPQRLRRCAEELLSGEGPGDGGKDRGTKYERSFLLAVSVLGGESMVRITSAALHLADLLDSVKTAPPAPDSVWSAFDERLGNWLRYARADDTSETDEIMRRIRLRTPALTAAVLDVAWHDHPILRAPLTAWLHALTRDPDPRIRMAAAQAVGKLAGYDYAEIEAEFISGWVRSNHVEHHWLAAWALEVAARHPALTGRVRGLLRTWARGSLVRRSAAARAYGTSLGGMFFHDALLSLRGIAVSGPRLRDEVARAMTELFLQGFRDAVVDELARWAHADDTGLNVAVSRSLVRLALVPGDEAGGRPALLTMLGGGDDTRRARIGGLWRSAFTDAETSGRAWTALLHWIQAADRAPGLVGAIGALVAELGSDARLNVALRFHLLWWGGGKIPPHVADTLLSHLDSRSFR
ncbi:hypothetical protein [Streptosporangium sp. V21-05]|uniref:hypothetical protein n=1 Tax=Streptosporangium sp. V21-05 TaxID=3446115 RepID=UPI003F530E91